MVDLCDEDTPSGESHVRIGAVPYLNAKVLVWGLDTTGPGYSLTFHTPSLLARLLKEGEVDVGLVSSIEFFRHPEYLIIPGMGVCGQDEMWSIRLFHRVPIHALRVVALDPASETTNALLRIVLSERLGLTPRWVELSDGENPVDRDDVDAFLKIGDPCLTFSEPGYEAYDVLSEWRELTGLPFVFALWLVRKGVDLQGLDRRLLRAREEGLTHADEIARAYQRIIGATFERALRYITEIIRYDVEVAELGGLRCFGEKLRQHGLLTSVRPLAFYES